MEKLSKFNAPASKRCWHSPWLEARGRPPSPSRVAFAPGRPAGPPQVLLPRPRHAGRGLPMAEPWDCRAQHSRPWRREPRMADFSDYPGYQEVWTESFDNGVGRLSRTWGNVDTSVPGQITLTSSPDFLQDSGAMVPPTGPE